MMRIRIHSILFFLILPLFLFAKENDFETWNSVELKTKLIKKTDFIFEGGLRLFNKPINVSSSFSDLSIKRKYNDVFFYSLGYRYILKKNDSAFDRKNRYYADLNIKNSFSPQIQYSLRTRFQSQVEGDFSVTKDVTNKIREKIKLTYGLNSSNVDFFLSAELFYVINSGFEKLRYIAGVEKPIAKKMNMSISSMYQHSINPSDELLFVFRCKLCYRI